MLFKTDTEKAFGVETYLSPEMDAAIKLWGQLESGKPPWLKDSDGRTVAFWNTIAEEWAKLITQNIDIKVQGIRSGEMPEKMQGIIDKYFLKNARDNIHAMVFWGGIMAKWDGEGIEFLKPNMFLPTEYDSSGEIKAAIFFSYYQDNKKFYTKAEWHRFETETKDGVSTRIYHVSTKAFRSDNQDDMGREVQLSETKWKDIEPEFWAENLENPLFRYIKCPVYNFIDSDSPLGIPCFANCKEELRWLDIAMSTLGKETKNSSPMLIVDQSVIQYATMNGIELPEWICDTGYDLSDGNGDPVREWQPTLQVTSRIEGINFYLNVISVKTGFSQGYFSFNEHQGLITATQVEADERSTISTMMDYRNILDKPNSNGDGRVGAIHDIAYIINAMLVINGDVPLSDNGNYKLFCDFGDPFENKQEDMMLDLQLANQGYISKAQFLVMHRGYTEEQARKMVEDARRENEAGKENILFGEE